MIDRITALFSHGHGKSRGKSAGIDDEVKVAAAALLVEAASLDNHFDAPEHARIAELLARRFDLTEAETESLIARAEKKVADSAQILPFTRVIKDNFSPEQRIEMVEMLWEVVYADGVLHDHEATLMRRVGGLVYVTDQERGAARKRALARLRSASDKK